MAAKPRSCGNQIKGVFIFKFGAIVKDSHPLVFSPAHAVVCQKQFKEKPYWFEKDSFLTIHPRGTADTCPARPGTRCLPLLPPRYPANPGPLGTGSTSLSPLTQENRISSTHITLPFHFPPNCFSTLKRSRQVGKVLLVKRAEVGKYRLPWNF